MTVDDLDYGVAQLIQTVEHDLIAVAKVERETVQHVLVGPKDLTIHFCQLKFFRCHRIYPFLNKFSLIITQKIAKCNKNIEKINANEIN